MIPVTAFKNSTRHFNMNSGMPLHTRYLHDLNSEFFVSVYYHTACSYPDCKQEDLINCEAAILDHKRFMKWQDVKRGVVEISDDDEDNNLNKNSNKDKVASPSVKVPPNPPMLLRCLQPARCSHCQRI